jgi:dTDP-4-amino-4,6-dideoxygalactose transaminase
MEKRKILVTRPQLPPLNEFIPLLADIWESRWLTNNGKFHQEFEKALAAYLGVPYVCLFANGTLALMAALQCLRIKGEVITTPYSFVATTHSLWWNGIKPVFVDIDPEYGNIDPRLIESAITPQTTAILPVHVYGNPCNVEKIQNLADIYGLKVIYDAAHAFGVRKNGSSIFNYGDLSIVSFHATKVFNTIEGGAIICHDLKTKKRIDYLKNFGIANETTVVAPGINAKMNEIQAAYGLLQLKYFDTVIDARKHITEKYREGLKDIPGVHYLVEAEGVDYNYSYFPVFIDENEYGKSRDEVYEALKKKDIYGRRYFYPLISEFPAYRGLPSAEGLDIAYELSRQVICLPLYPDLPDEIVETVVDLIAGMAEKERKKVPIKVLSNYKGKRTLPKK